MLRVSPSSAVQAGPGSNHVGLRAANERLVLSLIRAHGQLSKAQIAELSGLTAQTASVISRSLVDAGLLLAGAPVRGRVGQPYVPLSLNPDGAMFLGVHVDRAETRMALVNFTGGVVAEKTAAIAEPTLDRIVRAVRETITKMRLLDDAAGRTRFQGIGLSIASGSLERDRARTPWQDIEAGLSRLGQSLDLATYVSSDALAACSAELIYGLGSGVADFLYVFVDESISGGLVQGGRIRFSRDDAGANIGKVLVPNTQGQMVPLRTISVGTPRRAASAKSVDLLARGIAQAVIAAASLAPFATVIVDGSVPQETLQQITVKLRAWLAELGGGEAAELGIREGSQHRKNVALGAACLPLADRFYPRA